MTAGVENCGKIIMKETFSEMLVSDSLADFVDMIDSREFATARDIRKKQLS